MNPLALLVIYTLTAHALPFDAPTGCNPSIFPATLAKPFVTGVPHGGLTAAWVLPVVKWKQGANGRPDTIMVFAPGTGKWDLKVWARNVAGVSARCPSNTVTVGR